MVFSCEANWPGGIWVVWKGQFWPHYDLLSGSLVVPWLTLGNHYPVVHQAALLLARHARPVRKLWYQQYLGWHRAQHVCSCCAGREQLGCLQTCFCVCKYGVGKLSSLLAVSHRSFSLGYLKCDAGEPVQVVCTSPKFIAFHRLSQVFS